MEYKASKRNFRAHHRLCAENYLSEINDEIDQAAEVDSSFFWKKVNSRRQQSNSHAGSELKFANRVCRDPAEIVSEWGCYFRKLYSPNVSTNFDPLFKVSVDRRVHHIIEDFANSCQTNLTAFTPDEVSNAVRSLKRKKACGFDCIFNEHLIYGGNILHKELSLLFNDMYSCGYVPDRLKRGIIVTIHKGGKKSKTDPDNYRAVTLSSCILKLFERLLLHRVESALSIPLNSMQGGFRATLGCNMSSLMLRECVSFAKENHSKLFACFLDVQKAFDSVWHNGLFVKLYDMGIWGNLLRIIVNLHSGMESAVLYKGRYSVWFPVKQGTRQGGVLSPFLYLCFINGLINELTSSSFGFRMSGRNICCPTVADDMLLMSFSKTGLEQLINICFAYSCKWRYAYGAQKSAVVVFNESKVQYTKSKREWFLGPLKVVEAESYRYLGTVISKYLTLKVNVKDACNKLKGTFVSLISSGIV
ncbi:MAG: reverse transcriptase family protein, partial [Candidatus Thiodiazotropha taylori]|nr:reverse transcriptase family protein [Candidatus Thiodiazotropha taylori]MCW4336781.1 reverse transcriptase family protein [Candidatus Thiodiazotropha endolucinida]